MGDDLAVQIAVGAARVLALPPLFELPTTARYATMARIVDGDTVHLWLNAYESVRVLERVRIRGYNAPERYTEAGQASLVVLTALLVEAEALICIPYLNARSFERRVCDLWVRHPRTSEPALWVLVSEYMIAHGGGRVALRVEDLH